MRPELHEANSIKPILIGVKELRRILGLSEKTIHGLAMTREMPSPVHIGRRVLWRLSEVEAWVEALRGAYKNAQEYSEALAARDALDQFVYLMESAGVFKIGVSTRVTKRKSELQCGNPHDVNLVWHTKYRIKKPLAAERALHDRYAQYRNGGEWFSLPDEAVGEICGLHVMQGKLILPWVGGS